MIDIMNTEVDPVGLNARDSRGIE